MTPCPQPVAPTAHRAPGVRDRGQGTLEYVGIVALAVLLVAAVVVAVNPRVGVMAARAVCQVATLGQGDCQGDDPAPDGDDGFWCFLPWACNDDEQDGGEEQEEEQTDDDGDDGFWCFLPWACNEDDEAPEQTPPPTPTATPQPTDPANGLPVVDGVTIPDGLAPDDQVVLDLLTTQQGREALQWLADQGIKILDSFNGTYWTESYQEISIDTGLTSTQQPRSVVHEARHAREDAEGTSPDRTATTRDEYVQRMIDEETRAVVDEITLSRALQDAGTPTSTEQADTNYWKAYDAAVAAGQDEQAAQAAGSAAVREMFTSGWFRTSTTKQPYVEYYGEQWDKGQG